LKPIEAGFWISPSRLLEVLAFLGFELLALVAWVKLMLGNPQPLSLPNTPVSDPLEPRGWSSRLGAASRVEAWTLGLELLPFEP